MASFNLYRRLLGSLIPNVHYYLVRHIPTEGNECPLIYGHIADHAIMPTQEGYAVGNRTGEFLANLLYTKFKKNPLLFSHARVVFTPYYRGRLTANRILYALGETFGKNPSVISYLEEMFLYEQKAGLFDGHNDRSFSLAYPSFSHDYQKHIDHYGRVYACSPLGESRMDTAQRTKFVIGTLSRDSRNIRLLKGQAPIRHFVVVSHGVTVRAQVMTMMRYVPEWMDAERNPGNGWVREIVGNPVLGFRDKGYIYGEGAPLNDPQATQRPLSNTAPTRKPLSEEEARIQQAKCAEMLKRNREVIILKPWRDTSIIPTGANVRVIDPYLERYAL